MNQGIGKAIKFHRLKRGLTQKEVSEGIISVSYLSKIENDSIEPPHEVVQSIYERLQITTEQTKYHKRYINEWFDTLLKKSFIQRISCMRIILKIS
ncbi:helix-turn-helix domain-containing protein [Alkalibacillus aidingensis]|uniref:helix-turn-helix domain-containing protein n=1 Tax=Alkalibacillus aidingensis TaxID=2747607 RepID=UPI001660D435|nr:helix-turn-helix transcriptional regulator [Alkalibacillus aidingensis]